MGRRKEEAMISIGAVFNGPELKGSALSKKLMETSAAIKDLRGSLDDGIRPWVNAVFVVPGSLGSPGFHGLIYGEYSKKNKGVVVQIAVPIDILSLEDPSSFIIEGLRGANAMAFHFFQEKGEDFPLAEAEFVVTKVQQRLWKPIIVK